MKQRIMSTLLTGLVAVSVLSPIEADAAGEIQYKGTAITDEQLDAELRQFFGEDYDSYGTTFDDYKSDILDLYDGSLVSWLSWVDSDYVSYDALIDQCDDFTQSYETYDKLYQASVNEEAGYDVYTVLDEASNTEYESVFDDETSNVQSDESDSNVTYEVRGKKVTKEEFDEAFNEFTFDDHKFIFLMMVFGVFISFYLIFIGFGRYLSMGVHAAKNIAHAGGALNNASYVGNYDRPLRPKTVDLDMKKAYEKTFGKWGDK